MVVCMFLPNAKQEHRGRHLTLPPIMTVLGTKAWVGSFFIPARQTEDSQVRQLEPDTPEPCACHRDEHPQRPAQCKRHRRSFCLQNSALRPGWCQRLTRSRFFQKVQWKSCAFVSRTARDRSSFGSGDQD